MKTIALRRSVLSPDAAFIAGDHFGGEVSLAELREMASPEWAERCKRLADEIEGPYRAALREAAQSSERASERLRAAQAAREPAPETQRSTVPQKRGEP